MTGSALVGQPPATEEDFLIIRGALRVAHLPDSDDMVKKGISSVKVPPGAAHDSRQGTIIAQMAVTIALISLITITRLLLRAFKRDLKWGLDDWAIIMGLIGVIAWLTLTILMATEGGAGKHIYDLTYAQYNRYIYIAKIDTMLFFVSLALVKVSIVLFNRRLTGLTSRRWQIAHWTFLGILFVYILVVIFRSCFNCYPPSMDWGLRGRGEPSTAPQCSDDVKSILGYSAVHIALDWALLAVPLIVLYKIEKMSLSKKIRIGMLFSIGLVACIGSAMRQYMQNHSYKDRVYHYPEQLKWTIVDIFFGTIVASMPVLNALIPRRWRKADGHILPDSLTIFRSSRGSKGKGAVSLDSESTGGNSQHSALSQQATKDQKSSANVANETQFQMEDVDGEADNTRKEPMYDGSDRAPRPTPREGFSRSPYGPADFA